MKQTSIFNHVIGPVMRGPSSSHTAGAFHIGKMASSLLGSKPLKAECYFDTDGSYGKTYHEQGADLAFAAGLMGWNLTDKRFFDALDIAAKDGLEITFKVKKLKNPDHPNTIDIQLSSIDGRQLETRANSIGGGAVEFTRIEDWQISFTGSAYEVAVEVGNKAEAQTLEALIYDNEIMDEPMLQSRDGLSLICIRRKSPLSQQIHEKIKDFNGFGRMWIAEPVFFVPKSDPIFSSAKEIISIANERGISLGQLALEYESKLLGMTEKEVLDEMIYRFNIMREAVNNGLKMTSGGMQLIEPSAGKIFNAEAEKRVAIGGLHTRAAARSMAAMHVNSSMGVVCAAPTGGSAGTLPGTIVTLVEDKGLSLEKAAMSLLAAGIIGVIVANRATFAAEVAGCQVEIGAAGAMASAAVVDAFGGNAQQAIDAAAIAFQNTMGSVCDLVQGFVEIPCHTRNAVASSNAFICADLILGGYANPINLDETIDAVYSVGKMLPHELRCTALGGLATTPSALAMKRLRQ
jgi:L-serine dehydratase